MENYIGTLVWVALVGGVVSVILIELPRIVVWCLELVEKYHKLKSRRTVLIREAPVEGLASDSEEDASLD